MKETFRAYAIELPRDGASDYFLRRPESGTPALFWCSEKAAEYAAQFQTKRVVQVAVEIEEIK